MIVCDFGVGLFGKDLIEKINKLKIPKFINVQTNSINYGENLFTKYSNFKYISLDKREWELAGYNTDINISTCNFVLYIYILYILYIYIYIHIYIYIYI